MYLVPGSVHEWYHVNMTAALVFVSSGELGTTVAAAAAVVSYLYIQLDILFEKKQTKNRSVTHLQLEGDAAPTSNIKFRRRKPPLLPDDVHQLHEEGVRYAEAPAKDRGFV